MPVFKEETETKRVIFNVRMDLAVRLEKAKEDARVLGKKLDIETTVDKALEKFLRKAEKKLAELHEEHRRKGRPARGDEGDETERNDQTGDTDSEVAGRNITADTGQGQRNPDQVHPE